MGEKASSEQFPNDWIAFFSEPDQFLARKGILLEKEYPSPLRLALWLEYFLTAGVKPLEGLWARLPMEEQKVLGVEILKCYLFQPLFIRMSPEGKSLKPTPTLLLKKQGKILTVERGTEPDGPDGEVWFYYPLVHNRLWPGLLTLFQGEILSFEEVFKSLEPELTIAASSQLETIRKRAKTLRSLFSKEPDEGVPFPMTPNRPNQSEKIGTFNVEDDPAQVPMDVRFSEGDKSAQPPASVPDISPVQPVKSQKKKKKKPVPDQMKLF
ncbi:MAG: hypothetical protein WA974_00525 [Thermodesulfobacteriota bacterium]